MEAIDYAPEPGPVLTKALLRVAEAWKLKGADLAAVLGVHPSSISRLRKGEMTLSPGQKDGELALLVVRIFRSLDAIVGGNDEKSRDWIHAHHHRFGVSPIEHMKSIEGVVNVLRYLDAMRGRI